MISAAMIWRRTQRTRTTWAQHHCVQRGTFCASCIAYADDGRHPMLDRTGTLFSHVRDSDSEWRGDGLRDFFLYRDLGIAQATHGKVLAQLVKAQSAPE